VNSEDYNSRFQMFRLAPSMDELKEQTEEDTKTNFQIYMKEDIVEAAEEEVTVSQREHSVPEVRFSTRTDSREMEEPAQEEKVAPKQYSEARFWDEPAQEEEKIAPRHYSDARFCEVPAQEEEKVAPRQHSETSFWEPPAQEEERAAPRQHSETSFWQEPAQEEERAAPRQYSEARFWEEPVQEEEKAAPRQYSEAGFWEEPVQEEEKVAPRQYSRDSQQSEARVSPSLSVQEVEEPVKEEGRASPRDSLSQEARVPARVIAKMVDELLKEDVKVLADRKLKRITSFPKIPSDEIKSPVKELQVAPRVASIEEIIEEISHPGKEEVKRPTVEARETMNEAPTATEEGEMLVPQNFKVRTSKKRFSKRF
jgi:hypothetical protein